MARKRNPNKGLIKDIARAELVGTAVVGTAVAGGMVGTVVGGPVGAVAGVGVGTAAAHKFFKGDVKDIRRRFRRRR